MKHPLSASNSGKRMSSRINSQRGFSMIEIIITLGILSLVVAGIATFITNTGKQAQSVAQKSDFNSMVNEIQGVFNNTGTCLAAIGPLTLPASLSASPAVPFPITLKVGTSQYKTGVKYGKTLTIMRLDFTGMTQASSAGQYVVPLELHVSRKMGDEPTIGGDLLRPHIFNLILAVDATRKVVGCSGQFSNYWVGASNSTQNITYMGGNVGVGTDSPGASFDVNGTAQAVAFMYNSDARLKENVREIPSALERVVKLHGVLYDWKDKSHLTNNGTDQLGLLAQEVEKVFPEAVNTNSVTGMKTVGYGNLLAPMIEALKEQQEIILRQQQEISELKKAVFKR